MIFFNTSFKNNIIHKFKISISFTYLTIDFPFEESLQVFQLNNLQEVEYFFIYYLTYINLFIFALFIFFYFFKKIIFLFFNNFVTFCYNRFNFIKNLVDQKQLLFDAFLVASILLLLFKIIYYIIFIKLPIWYFNLILFFLFSFFSWYYKLIFFIRDFIAIKIFCNPKIIPTISVYSNYQHFYFGKKLSYNSAEWAIDDEGFREEPDHFLFGDVPLPEYKLYKTYLHYIIENILISFIWVRLIILSEPIIFMILRIILFAFLIFNKAYFITFLLSFILIFSRIIFHMSDWTMDDIKRTITIIAGNDMLDDPSSSYLFPNFLNSKFMYYAALRCVDLKIIENNEFLDRIKSWAFFKEMSTTPINNLKQSNKLDFSSLLRRLQSNLSFKDCNRSFEVMLKSVRPNVIFSVLFCIFFSLLLLYNLCGFINLDYLEMGTLVTYLNNQQYKKRFFLAPSRIYDNSLLFLFRPKFRPPLSSNYDDVTNYHPSIMFYNGSDQILNCILTSHNIFNKRLVTALYPNFYINNNKLINISNSWELITSKDSNFSKQLNIFNEIAVVDSEFENFFYKGHFGPTSIYHKFSLEKLSSEIPNFDNFLKFYNSYLLQHTFLPENISFLFTKLLDLSYNKIENKYYLLEALINLQKFNKNILIQQELELLVPMVQLYPAAEVETFLKFSFSNYTQLYLPNFTHLPNYDTSTNLPLLTKKTALITDIWNFDRSASRKIFAASSATFHQNPLPKSISVDYLRYGKRFPAKFYPAEQLLLPENYLRGDIEILPYRSDRLSSFDAFIQHNDEHFSNSSHAFSSGVSRISYF